MSNEMNALRKKVLKTLNQEIKKEDESKSE